VRRFLFIIARRDPFLHGSLKDRFADHADIDVILDRRHAQRRRQVIPTEVDRRLRGRRTVHIDALLRQMGWVVVERRV